MPQIVSRLCLVLPVAVVTFAQAEVSVDVLIEESRLQTAEFAMRDRDGWQPPKKIVVRASSGITDSLEESYDTELVLVYSRAEALAEAGTADAIVGYCDAELLGASKNLQWVQIYSSGAERCLSVEPVGRGDVVLSNMQKMSSPVIGEHAVAMAMSLSRGLVQYGKSMPAGQWNRRPDSFAMQSLGGKTMLVVGLGGIGTEAARRASALGMTVLGTRNSSREGPDFVEYVGLSDELYELAARADVVVNALPLTPATTDIFDERFFIAVKQGVIFINVGRGGSVVTADLVDALRNGRVSAAGLDVTEPEPLPPDHELWQMQNVIITPHVAATGSGRARHAALLAENLRRFRAGDALLNVVDPDRGY